MKKTDLTISIVAGLILGLLMIFMKGSDGLMQAQPVSAQSPMDSVLTAVLNSDTKWQTVQGEADITWYGKNGDIQSYTTIFVISQPDQAFVETIDNSGVGNGGAWISNGEQIYELNSENKTYTESVFPKHFRDVSLLPRSLNNVEQGGMVTVHPLSLLIPSPIKEYIFPSAFVQVGPQDTYSLVGADTFLDKPVWVVNYKNAYGDEVTAWVDQGTGMIVKFSQLTAGKPYLDVVFKSIQIDQPVSADTFAVPAGYNVAVP